MVESNNGRGGGKGGGGGRAHGTRTKDIMMSPGGERGGQDPPGSYSISLTSINRNPASHNFTRLFSIPCRAETCPSTGTGLARPSVRAQFESRRRALSFSTDSGVTRNYISQLKLLFSRCSPSEVHAGARSSPFARPTPRTSRRSTFSIFHLVSDPLCFAWPRRDNSSLTPSLLPSVRVRGCSDRNELDPSVFIYRSDGAPQQQ